jgi:dihydroxy-acid dehydratase
LRSGDRVRIDLNTRSANILISEAEYAARAKQLKAEGGYKSPKSQTPWQEIQRKLVGQLNEGMVLKPAVKYKRIVRTFGTPRDNH